jgi:hypothetical protein
VLGVISSGDLWGGVVAVSGSVLLGAIGVVWKLGRLEGQVTTTLDDHERRIDNLEHPYRPPARARGR